MHKFSDGKFLEANRVADPEVEELALVKLCYQISGTHIGEVCEEIAPSR